MSAVRALALAILLLLPSAAAAQRPSIDAAYIAQSWGTAQGLPQNTVTAILQTRDGYLWLGTFGGLIRFDGHTFTVFDPGNAPGLASARISALHEDRDGVLWIGTEAGPTRYEAGRFTSYFERDGLPHGHVLALMADRHNRLWIGTVGGAARLEAGTLRPFRTANAVIDVRAFVEAPDGDIWIWTHEGIERAAGGEASTVIAALGVNAAAVTLYVDRGGQLWAASAHLHRWNGSTFVEVPLGIPASRYGVITAITEDRDGAMWLATQYAGVMRVREGTTDIYATHAPGLANAFVRSLYLDRAHNIWAGTDVGGLHRLKRRRARSDSRASSTAKRQFLIPNSPIPSFTVHLAVPLQWPGADGCSSGHTPHARLDRARRRGNGVVRAPVALDPRASSHTA